MWWDFGEKGGGCLKSYFGSVHPLALGCKGCQGVGSEHGEAAQAGEAQVDLLGVQRVRDS